MSDLKLTGGTLESVPLTPPTPAAGAEMFRRALGRSDTTGATRPATQPDAAPETAPAEGARQPAPPATAETPEKPVQPEAQEPVAEPLPSSLGELAKGLGLEESDLDGLKFKVRVNGEDVEVTLGDARKGYSRQADYDSNSAALRKEREQFKTQSETQMREAQQHLQAVAQSYVALEELIVGKPPDPAMLDPNSPSYNSDLYHRQKAEHEERGNKYRNTLNQLGQIQQAQQVEMNRRLQEHLAGQTKLLATMLPVSADAEKWPKERDAITAFLRDGGANDAEINAIGRDARLTTWAWQAKEYVRMEKEGKAAKALADKRVEHKPKYLKPGTSTTPAERSKQGEAALVQQFARNPRDRSVAAAVFGRALAPKR